MFWKDNLLHRENNLPAISTPTVSYFFKNGLKHNEHGPAAIYESGNEHYYLNDKKFSKEEWEIEIEKSLYNKR